MMFILLSASVSPQVQTIILSSTVSIPELLMVCCKCLVMNLLLYIRTLDLELVLYSYRVGMTQLPNREIDPLMEGRA